MTESYTNTFSAPMNYHRCQKEVLLNAKVPFIKGSNMLAGNVTIELLKRYILLNTKGHYMRKSDNLAINVTIDQIQWDVLINIRGQKNSLARHMKNLQF